MRGFDVIGLKKVRTGFRNVLRFFNLLEPGLPYMVLSLSKLSVYMTMGLMAYVVYSGAGVAEVGAALAANLGSVANYAYRRKKQVETCTAGYAASPVCDDGEDI